MTGRTVNLVLDTNVFISAVFFSGIPYRILNAWRKGRVRLFVSRLQRDRSYTTYDCRLTEYVSRFSATLA